MDEEPGIIAADERDLLAQAAEWPQCRSSTELTQSALSALGHDKEVSVLPPSRVRGHDLKPAKPAHPANPGSNGQHRGTALTVARRTGR